MPGDSMWEGNRGSSHRSDTSHHLESTPFEYATGGILWQGGHHVHSRYSNLPSLSPSILPSPESLLESGISFHQYQPHVLPRAYQSLEPFAAKAIRFGDIPTSFPSQRPLAPSSPFSIRTIDPRAMFSRDRTKPQSHSRIGVQELSAFQTVLPPLPDNSSPQSSENEDEDEEDQEGKSEPKQCATKPSMGIGQTLKDLDNPTASPMSTAVQSPITEDTHPASLGIVRSEEPVSTAASLVHPADGQGRRSEDPSVPDMSPRRPSSTTCSSPRLLPGKKLNENAVFKREAIRRLADYSSDSDGSSSSYLPVRRVTRRSAQVRHITDHSSSPHLSPVVCASPEPHEGPEEAGTADSESDYAPSSRPVPPSRKAKTARAKEANAKKTHPKGQVKRGGPVRKSQNRKAQSVYREKKKTLAALDRRYIIRCFKARRMEDIRSLKEDYMEKLRVTSAREAEEVEDALD